MRNQHEKFYQNFLSPGMVFSKKDAVAWFKERYPKIKEMTVSNHIDWAAVNSHNRRHHPSLQAGKGWDLFYRISSDKYRLWQEGIDPDPIYKADIEKMLEENPNTKGRNPEAPVNFWIEKTNVKGRPDREAGEYMLGAALWSPQTSDTGADIYSNMRKVKEGDIVLHLTDNKAFSGISVVSIKYDDSFSGIPGTNWANKPGYMIKLEDYEEISPPLPREEFLTGSSIETEVREIYANLNGKGLFFNRNLDLNQGAYLTSAPTQLIALLNSVYVDKTGRSLPKLAKIDFKKEDEMEPIDSLKKTEQHFELNTILYGPPGTGKTWTTAKMAVEICDGSAAPGRDDLMKRYNELVKANRISFTTFHQSLGYEEFVEGLRPTTDGSDGEEGSSVGFRLETRKGIFRELCALANQSRLKGGATDKYDFKGRRIFKMSLGRANSQGHIFDAAVEQGYIALAFGGDVDWSDPKYKSFSEVKDKWLSIEPDASSNRGDIAQTWCFRGAMDIGDIVIISDGNHRFRAIAEITGDYEFAPAVETYPNYIAEDGVYCHRRSVKWLTVLEESLPATSISDKNFTQISCYTLENKRINFELLESLIPGTSSKENNLETPENFVLIVDEINRANISKVFGELITLIEPDKRLGAGPNALRVTLPYSNDAFGIPNNLYIIGTMNTADRSIALLDTALRRRFDFQEMMPNYEIPAIDRKVDNIHLGDFLAGINRRVEWLFDRDHQIGHSFLTGVKSKSDLDLVVRNKIIPLLIEYFYEDWEKVRAALNDAKQHFIQMESLSSPPLIEDEGEPRVRYSVKAAAFPIEAYEIASQ